MNQHNADRLEQIIVEHTRLALEACRFPANGGNTPEEAEQIARRKREISKRISELREERNILYEV